MSTVVCGHTHMPFVRLVHGRLVLNPGSVGTPYGRPGAHWALPGGGTVALRRSEFGYDAACTSIVERCAYPRARTWADFFIRGRGADAEALAMFKRTLHATQGRPNDVLGS